MNFDRFITRPVLSTVISIIIVILGVIGLIQLPLEQYPNLAPPTVQVSTAYAGADAQTVLNSVVIPLEEQINGVEGMTYMTSTATNSGGASITVYFKEGTDPDMAARLLPRPQRRLRHPLGAELRGRPREPRRIR